MICAQAEIRKANIPKKKMKELPTRPGYMVFIDISSYNQVFRGGNNHSLIAVNEFSHCSHSFYLSKKSEKVKMIPIWIKGLSRKHGIEIKRTRLDNSGETKVYKTNVTKRILV